MFIDQLLLLLHRIILMISLWSMLTRVSQSDYLLHWTLLFSISLSTVRHQHQTISNIQDKLWRSRNKNINHQRAIENTFIWDKLYQGLFTITTLVIYYKKKVWVSILFICWNSCVGLYLGFVLVLLKNCPDEKQIQLLTVNNNNSPNHLKQLTINNNLYIFERLNLSWIDVSYFSSFIVQLNFNVIYSRELPTSQHLSTSASQWSYAGWQNLNPLSHPDATLAPQTRQARASSENLNNMTLAPQARQARASSENLNYMTLANKQGQVMNYLLSH